MFFAEIQVFYIFIICDSTKKDLNLANNKILPQTYLTRFMYHNGYTV